MAGGEISPTDERKLDDGEILERIVEQTKGQPREREERIKALQEERARERGKEAIRVAS